MRLLAVLGLTMRGEISIPWSGGVTSVYEIHSSNINIKEKVERNFHKTAPDQLLSVVQIDFHLENSDLKLWDFWQQLLSTPYLKNSF